MDPMIIAAAVVLVFGALGGFAKLVIGALNDAKKELLTLQHDLAVDGKNHSDTLAEKAKVQGQEIHDLVNGNAHRAAEKLTSVETQLEGLRAEIKRLQEQRVEDAKTREAGAR